MQELNPELPLYIIHRDVENLLMELFINEIKNLEFSKKISPLELRKLNARQKLHVKSHRYPKVKLKLDRKKFDKLFRIFKIQQLKETVNIYQKFFNLEYLSNVGNHNSIFFNVDDKTYLEYNGKKEYDTDNYQETIKSKDNVEKESKTREFKHIKDSGSKKSVFEEKFFELDMYSNYFRKLDNIKRIKEKEIIQKIKLNSDLLERIQKVKFESIKKEKVKKIILSDIEDQKNNDFNSNV